MALRAAAALAALWCALRPAAADVTIALAVPLTGPRASAGEDMRRAADAMVHEINSRGGVLGERLVLRVEDDRCERPTAVQVARRLEHHKPALVVGHPCSGAAVAAAAVYAAAALLFISPGARHPALTASRSGKTIFRLAGRDDRQGAAAAEWLARSANGAGIIILRDGTLYARMLAQGAVRSLAASGTTGFSTLPISAGQKDYAHVAARLAAMRPGAVFFAGFPAEAILVLAAIRKAGISAAFLGADALATPGFGKELTPDLEPVRVLLPSDVEPRPDWHAADANELPNSSSAGSALAARTHRAIEAWAHAAQRAGTLATDRVAETLTKGAVATASSGPLTFDTNGDARVPSFEPARWSGTRWSPADQ